MQLRRDTAAAWTSADTLLANGEFGLELDTNRMKCGDGVTTWINLPYYGDAVMVDGIDILSTIPNDGDVLVYKVASGKWEISSIPATHNRQHVISNTLDHIGIAGTTGNLMSLDSNGLPADSGSKPSDFASASNEHTHINKTELDLITDGDHDIRTDNPHSVTKSQVLTGNLITNTDVDNNALIDESKLNLDFPTHTQQHNINSTVNHTGVPGAVENNVIIFNADGLQKDSGQAITDFVIKGLEDTFAVSAGRDKNTTDVYLYDGMTPSNLSPTILPFDCYLTAISASSNANDTWTAEVHTSTTLVPGASLSINAAPQGYSLYNVAFNAGDEVSLYCNGINVIRPKITAFFRRR